MKSPYTTCDGKNIICSGDSLAKDEMLVVFSEVVPVDALVRITASLDRSLADGVRVSIERKVCGNTCSSEDCIVTDYSVLTAEGMQDIFRHIDVCYAIVPIKKSSCCSVAAEWMRSIAYDSLKSIFTPNSVFELHNKELPLSYAEPIVCFSNDSDEYLEYVVFNKDCVSNYPTDRLYAALLFLLHRQMVFMNKGNVNFDTASPVLRRMIATLQLLIPGVKQAEKECMPELNIEGIEDMPALSRMKLGMEQFLRLMLEKSIEISKACAKAEPCDPLCVIMYKAFLSLCSYINVCVEEINSVIYDMYLKDTESVKAMLTDADLFERLLVPYVRMPK